MAACPPEDRKIRRDIGGARGRGPSCKKGPINRLRRVVREIHAAADPYTIGKIEKKKEEVSNVAEGERKGPGRR